MNILCLDQFSELGGAQRCLLDLVPAMTGMGWRVVAAAPGDGPLAAQATALGAAFETIHCGPFTSGTKTAADVARFAMQTPRLSGEIGILARRYDADLIYVNGPRLLAATAIAARRGPPVLFHAHSLLGGFALRAAGQAIEKSGAAVVAACHFVAKPLARYARDGVRVVYNGVRASDVRRTPQNERGFRVGMIGRIAPEKGQADFLRAARILHEAAPDCRFIICGAPLFGDAASLEYRASLDELARGLPVEFTGWTNDVGGLLASLDLLAVPSAAVDATPRVIMEAFAAGVPVVAFAAGGIPELIEDGVTGLLVRKPSPEALAAALGAAVHSPETLQKLAERARAKATTTFSLGRYQSEMIAALEQAAAPRANKVSH